MSADGVLLFSVNSIGLGDSPQQQHQHHQKGKRRSNTASTISSSDSDGHYHNTNSTQPNQQPRPEPDQPRRQPPRYRQSYPNDVHRHRHRRSLSHSPTLAQQASRIQALTEMAERDRTRRAAKQQIHKKLDSHAAQISEIHEFLADIRDRAKAAAEDISLNSQVAATHEDLLNQLGTYLCVCVCACACMRDHITGDATAQRHQSFFRSTFPYHAFLLRRRCAGVSPHCVR